MQTTEQRMQCIRSRTREIRRKRLHRRWILSVSLSLSLCTAAVVLLAVSFSGITRNLPNTPVTHTSGTASLIGSGNLAGILLMGVLCFLLGICVTVLLYKIKERNRRDKDKYEL